MQKILFIVNPIAGNKDKQPVIDDIRRRLDEEKYISEFVFTQYQGHASELARETDAEIVVAIGGDGTVSEVAQSLCGTGKILGLIPCGSGDGLALHLGIRRNVADAVDTINGGLVIEMDYAEVCGKPFFCTAGMGIDALVSFKFAESGERGLKSYIIDALETWKNFRPEHYEIRTDGGSWSGEAAIVTIANANQWGNRAKIAPHASVSDGLLDVTIVKPFRNTDIPILADRLMHGTLDRSSLVETFRATEVKITRERPGPMHLDGDPCEMGTEICIKVIPAALRIIVPPEKKQSNSGPFQNRFLKTKLILNYG